MLFRSRGTWDGAGGFTWNGRVLRAGGNVPAGPATLTIRPEHLSPADAEDAGDNVLEGVVQGKIFLGPVTRVACSIGEETLLMDLLSTDGDRLGSGQALRVCFSVKEFHMERDADVTLAFTPIDVEPGRFGIAELNAEGRIMSYMEKPKHPRTNLASMTVYVFRRDVLVEELRRHASASDQERKTYQIYDEILPNMMAHRRAFG